MDEFARWIKPLVTEVPVLVIPTTDVMWHVWAEMTGRGATLEVVRGHLRRSRAKRMLIGAINDPSALGALRAMEEAGRAETCAVMGQNASLEARAELRNPDTGLIGIKRR
jgi:hypothetical protein